MDRASKSYVQRARRVSLWGLIIVGFLGLVLVINAALSDDYVGAGVLAAASALAFGFLGHTFGRD